MLSFISALFDLYEKQVNKGMSMGIWITNFHVLCHHILRVDQIMHVNFLFKTHLHRFEMMCHLYFSKHTLIINYKYVHIVITIALCLNKDFYFFILFSSLKYISAFRVYGCTPIYLVNKSAYCITVIYRIFDTKAVALVSKIPRYQRQQLREIWEGKKVHFNLYQNIELICYGLINNISNVGITQFFSF